MHGRLTLTFLPPSVPHSLVSVAVLGAGQPRGALDRGVRAQSDFARADLQWIRSEAGGRVRPRRGDDLNEN